MRQIWRNLACSLSVALLLGCSPSPETIGSSVKDLFQQRLSGQTELKNLDIRVAKVDVIHEQGNKYRGMALVTVNGTAHDVPMTILADSDKVMYEVSPDALSFIAVEAFKKSLQQSSPTVSPASEPSANIDLPPDIKILTDQVDALNDKCRGLPGGDPAGERACSERDEVGKLVRASGWCWGHKDDAGFQRKWVKCEPGDA